MDFHPSAGGNINDPVTTGWLSFWEREHPAFAPTPRSRKEGEDLSKRVIGCLELRPGATILDWGCGWALGTPIYREAGIQVLLYDRSRMYAKAAQKQFDGQEGVAVLAKEDLAKRSPKSIDAVLVFSVLQYLKDEERNQLFRLCARLLKPSGAMILGDLLPPEGNWLKDLKSFLPRSRSPRRAFARLSAIGRLMASDYPWIRQQNGLRNFQNAELKAELAATGFDGAQLPQNLGPNRSRMSWLARPRPPTTASSSGPDAGTD